MKIGNFTATIADYPIIEYVGGGRCFKKNMVFDEVYNPELLKIINEIES